MQISETQHRSWKCDGWLALHGSIDERLLRILRQAGDELASWATAGGPGLHHFEMADRGPALARSERFADEHTTLGSFLRSGLATDILAQLFGEPAALFKEKVNYKQPGGAGFAPHHSKTNKSPRPRRVLYLTYNAASLGDFRDRYYADKDAEFAAGGSEFESGSPRISISDDFLDRPIS